MLKEFQSKKWIKNKIINELLSSIKHFENASYCMYNQYYLSWCVTFRQYRTLRFSGACDFFEAGWRELLEIFFIHSVLLLRGLYVCVCVGVRWTRLNYPLLLYSPLILIISGDLHWKAYRCRTGCSPQRLYSIIDTVLKFSQETHIFSVSWCFLINYYKALSSNIWVHPKCYPVHLECSIFWKTLSALTKLLAKHISDGLIGLKGIINLFFIWFRIWLFMSVYVH